MELNLISQNLSTDTAFALLADYTKKLLEGVTAASGGHVKTEVGVSPGNYSVIVDVGYHTNEQSIPLVQIKQNQLDPDMWDLSAHPRVAAYIDDKLQLNFTKHGMVHSHLHF